MAREIVNNLDKATKEELLDLLLWIGEGKRPVRESHLLYGYQIGCLLAILGIREYCREKIKPKPSKEILNEIHSKLPEWSQWR
jgi:hypothetical protein